MKRFLILLALLSLAGTAGAQTTRYVTDRLEVDMRSGQSTQHRIVSMLPSGTPVEVLEEDAASGWSRVRTSQGAEGWILTRFLDRQASARDRLARAERELATQRETVAELRQSLNTLSGEKSALERQVAQLTNTGRDQEQELARIRRTSASALALDEENRTLKEQLGRLERDHQMLQQQYEVLRDSNARDWVIVGAGIVLLGMVIGLIIPRIRWRRKSSWDRF